MRGRPPKPLERHRRDGTYRRDRHGDGLPVLVGGRPFELEPPADLPPAALEVWRLVVPELVTVGLVDRVDVPALVVMCTAYARMVEAGELVAAHGLVVESTRGTAIVNPAAKVERDASLLFLRYAEQFGLTPSARARLGLAGLKARTLAQETMARVRSAVKLEYR